MTEKIQLQVEGMSCEHCVNAVKTGVGELSGIETVDVNLEKGLVDVAYNASQVNKDDISNAIEEQGYTVK